MFINQATGLKVNIYAPFTAGDVRSIDLTIPVNRDTYGVVEIPDPVPPEDYSPETYFCHEQLEPPYVVYTPKPPEMIALQEAAKIEVRLNELRDVRGRMLDRLTGIRVDAREEGNNALADACKIARDGLLDITEDLPDTLAEVKEVIKNRYRDLVTVAVTSSGGELYSAFTGVDL